MYDSMIKEVDVRGRPPVTWGNRVEESTGGRNGRRMWERCMHGRHVRRDNGDPFAMLPT